MTLFPAINVTHEAKWLRFIAVLFFLLPLPLKAETTYLIGRIKEVHKNRITIELNSQHMPVPGDVGLIRSFLNPSSTARIISVKKNILTATIISHRLQGKPKVGEKVYFQTVFPLPFVPQTASNDSTPGVIPKSTAPSTLISTTSEKSKEEFVPLLEPITIKAKSTISKSKNLFHGRLRTREIVQNVSPSGEKNYLSRLDSDGSIDRLFSKPWSLNWSGNLRYRDGNTQSTADDFHKPQGYLYSLLLAGNISERTKVNIGRFIPFELPGLGYVDGAKVHIKKSNSLQLGFLSGARPDRQNLGFSGHEFMASSYLALQSGQPGQYYYSATLGLLRTYYRGKADELAVLYDQRTDLTRLFNLSVTSQIDFNGGNAKINKDPRLTRFDAYLTSRIISFLMLRGGINHYERPDTAVERELSGEDNLDAIKNSGSWRYSVGSQQNLPLKLSLDEDISYYKTGEELSKGFWRISLSRYGIFKLTQARVSFAGFNLSPFEGEGFGGLLTCSLPFKDNRLLVDLSYGLRYKGQTGEPKKYSTSDYSGRMLWRLSNHWDVDLGLSRVYQESVTSTVGDAGISYRW